MRKKRLLVKAGVLCMLVLLAFPAFSQQRLISGKVSDSTGAPISGVTITPQGAAGGTTTGSDGTFHLSVSSGTRFLIISSVGYATQRVPVSGATIQVTLASASSLQTEVVVIGYGTQQKRDLTGAISVVGTKDFQKGAITTPDQLIAGKMAGVQVTSNSGAPGASSTIRIRGISSLNSNNAPLIVIDGVEMPSSVNSNGTSDDRSTVAGIANPLDLLNPDDIETVTVLKDASAAAIYGSRASAGVILVTTKKGRGGKPVFNANTTLTAGTVAKKVSVLTAGQFRSYINAQVAQNPADSVYANMMGSANTDWQNQIFQTAITTNDNISMSGAAGKTPYRLSLGYHDEQGILKTDNLQRGTVGVHLTPRLLDDNLKIELNLNGAVTKSRFANQGAIGAAIAFDPTQSPYSKSNQFGGYYEWLNRSTGLLSALATRNPLALLEQDNNIGYSANSVGNLHVDYALPVLPGLHAIANLAYDISNGHGTRTQPANSAQAINNSPGPGYQSKYKQNNTYVLEEYSLNYIKDVPSIKSNFNVLGLYSYANNLITPYNYASLDAKGDTITGSKPVYPTSPYENTLISYVGRFIYTYDQRYILTASIRADGSSRFAPQNRWGTFPAVSVAWHISREEFLRNSNWLSDLKIRGSYGVTGNQDGLADYAYIPSYSLSGNNSLYQLGPSFYNMYTPAAYNPAFKWEQTTSTNVGVDFGLFNNRINGSVDYYNKSISNLFNSVFIPVGSNFTNQMTVNIGTMKDQGFELNLNATPVRGRKFSWDLNFNFTYNKNTITKLTNGNKNSNFLGDQVGVIGGGTGNTIQIQTVGYGANSFFVLQQIYDKSGQPIEGGYADLNRNGVINSLTDAYHYKSPFPPVAMGFSSTFNYDRWSLTLVARSNIGNYVYNNVESGMGATQYIMNPLMYLQNASTSIYKTHFYSPQYFSDYYVENASFVKLDNVGLTYNVGKIGHGANLRVSAYCQNVFVITKYDGIDPEVYNGIDNNIYPRPRNFTLGASINF
ncbi:MAG TPA: SusC/RagA family TonB-linked outer membrane protein [Puia sp.]|nr:SusC/RagA family TonB-linked outer membrane protein [Puia sp.]